MLTVEVRRRPGTGAEMHRVASGSATVGASSGNEIVVRARGVYGRHVRLFERDGGYHLDLFKGIETVQVNGRDFFGGADHRRRPDHDRRSHDHGGRGLYGGARRGRGRGRSIVHGVHGARSDAGEHSDPGHGSGPAGHRGRVPHSPARGVSALPRRGDTRGPRDRADRLSRSRAPALGMGGRRILREHRFPAARFDVPRKPHVAAAHAPGSPRGRAAGSRRNGQRRPDPDRRGGRRLRGQRGDPRARSAASGRARRALPGGARPGRRPGFRGHGPRVAAEAAGRPAEGRRPRPRRAKPNPASPKRCCARPTI